MRRFCALFAAAAASAAQAAGADSGAAIWDGVEAESLPDAWARAYNIAIISVVGGLTALGGIAIAAAALLRGSVRLPVLVLFAEVLVGFCSGLCSFALTYQATFTALDRQTTRLLLFAGGRAAEQVTADLGGGLLALEMAYESVQAGHINISAGWPSAHEGLARVFNVSMRHSHSLESLYFGTEAAEMQLVGLTTKSIAAKKFAVWSSQHRLEGASGRLACEDNARQYDTCQHPACAAEGGGASCELCYTELGVFSAARCGRAGCAPCAAWRSPSYEMWYVSQDNFTKMLQRMPCTSCLANDPHGRGYDPRARPWYRRQGLTWGAPYAYVSEDDEANPNMMGISLTRGLPNLDYDGTPYTAGVPADPRGNPWRGVIAADFSFTSISTFLRSVVPSEHGSVFLADRYGNLTGGSTDPQGFISCDGGGGCGAVRVSNHPITVPVFDPILRRFGTIRDAMDRTAVLRGDDGMVLSRSVDVRGGLRWLLAIHTPYRDVTQDSARATTAALLVVVAVSLAAALIGGAVVAVLMRPLQILAADMQLVAVMSLDTVSKHDPGVTTEVQGMSASFGEMVTNLVEYRRYLPTSVLDGDPDTTVSMEMEHAEILLSPSTGTVQVPKGTVAVCFTDIQRSTDLWEAVQEAMYNSLQIHNSILRKEISAHGGYEVKTIGDAFMTVFHRAADAVQFALSSQLRLVEQEWPEALLTQPNAAREAVDGSVVWAGLRVRIGINWGEARMEANPVTTRADYFGPTVNTAARVEAAGVGGVVAVTQSVLDELGVRGGGLGALAPAAGRAPESVDMGELALKGVAGRVRLWALLPAPLAARRAVLQSALRDRAAQRSPARPRRAERERPSTASTTSLDSDARFPPGALDSAGQPTLLSKLATGFSRHVATVGHAVAAPREVVSIAPIGAALSRFMQAAQDAADRTTGVVGSAFGVRAVAQWNAGRACVAHAAQAARWASLMHNRCGPQSPQYGLSSGGALLAGHGLASGAVLCGNVAAGRRRVSTVAGDAVELAARLADACADLGVQCLAAACGGAASAADDASVQRCARPVTRWPGVGCVVHELDLASLDESGGWSHLAADDDDDDVPGVAWLPEGYEAAFAAAYPEPGPEAPAPDPEPLRALCASATPDEASPGGKTSRRAATLRRVARAAGARAAAAADPPDAAGTWRPLDPTPVGLPQSSRRLKAAVQNLSRGLSRRASLGPERRVGPDGTVGTMMEFVDQYGGTEEWERARVLSPLRPPGRGNAAGHAAADPPVPGGAGSAAAVRASLKSPSLAASPSFPPPSRANTADSAAFTDLGAVGADAAGGRRRRRPGQSPPAADRPAGPPQPPPPLPAALGGMGATPGAQTLSETLPSAGSSSGLPVSPARDPPGPASAGAVPLPRGAPAPPA